ncbi:helix-turn-helix domain-containing protein [uncultured Parasutterella sp.]|uniref:helix-turn-helix domain-containing protein n=2 Tax=uncultured Parasutterella sp. TaxID=1263098 RepID=UPI00262C404F|nr:helix-turn-helix transcriptional regulator [uncultured Parasutterella sp.]
MFQKISLDAKKEQAALVKTIGERLKDARELCNLSQQSAAQKLGYRNSSKLAKVERATDTNSVPLWLIMRAAKLYEVSVDYLFGLNEDWEKSARLTIERQTGLWLHEQWEILRRRDLAVLQSLYARTEILDGVVAEQLMLTKELKEALNSFRYLNPDFDDYRGGNRLVSVSEKIQDAILKAESKLKRFRQECRIANAQSNLQLKLFKEEAHP